jgi:hypothetical protein
MGKINRNIVMKGASGSLGDITFKQYSYGMVFSKRPDRSKVTLSDKQKQANERFKAAVAYAREVQADPEKTKEYQRRLKPGQKVYHAALSDHMKLSRPPLPPADDQL